MRKKDYYKNNGMYLFIYLSMYLYNYVFLILRAWDECAGRQIGREGGREIGWVYLCMNLKKIKINKKV